ncbi:arsenate reductase ArsC [Methanospirillum sp. J.3.6.1-F.2.7.3]|uniref:Arsenate reductase ArsC n=1 Tax=Methanospirillum purgamenti TaxID=2834276 RepID=A0A8E7B0K0_9EURY|nr:MULTISPECIES: arsenate reductase ArsC [Methanospirillum]MDX8549187.1 arsenate reductase ArsC [Methanospirillum hungatei]QVV88856.1 arsenate reductase ArsC [Methanospirillum sp. J.3.6.1-F.2.7.3]
MKRKVLFICTHNSARSQMAEGYVNARYSDRYEGFSAGTDVTKVHPLAIRVMNEIGIDISHQKSKELEEFFDYEIDTVVTVCDGANAVCPMFPGAKETIHVNFPDPSSATGTEDIQLEMFRRVRDDILSFIDQQFGKKDT